MLYPQHNEIRSVFDLSGIWRLKVEKKGEDVDPTLALKDTILMAVPGSINDQVVDSDIRDHVGNFWYETDFTISKSIIGERKVLRFGSVTHEATVYVNGIEMGHHVGGFTPFEVELDEVVKLGLNNLKVKVSNILDSTTLPVGVHYEKGGKERVAPMFDFYNYSGIHRAVKLYTTGKTFVSDIIVDYTYHEGVTIVSPRITVHGTYSTVKVEVIDEVGNVVATSDQLDDSLQFTDTKLWQPLNAYLYQLKVSLYQDELLDTYTEEFGVRTFEIKDNQFLINGESFYFKGFGKHEDFPVIGKGHNDAVSNLDKNLLKWLGANSYRTSHYPYAEEELRLADREGIVIIDEVPGVGLFHRFNPDVTQNINSDNTWKLLDTFESHKAVIEELIQRDKNHPSVVSWAIANEPASHQAGAGDYFRPLVELTKELDHEKRPVVIPNIVNATPELDESAEFVDILCLNRYYGWYISHGDMEEAEKGLRAELERWHAKYPDKPIIFSEFGADTVSGLHSLYRTPYSEEYQIDFYRHNFKVLDDYSYVIGEHLWNFSDFETASNIRRVDGNKKGIFSRDRRPKAIAFEVKKRWEQK